MKYKNYSVIIKNQIKIKKRNHKLNNNNMNNNFRNYNLK